MCRHKIRLLFHDNMKLANHVGAGQPFREGVPDFMSEPDAAHFASGTIAAAEPFGRTDRQVVRGWLAIPCRR
jgi:hypothetical protein